jgi:hypothetical protein
MAHVLHSKGPKFSKESVMSLFSTILNKLGIENHGRGAAVPPPVPSASGAPPTSPPVSTPSRDAGEPVDVVSQLEKRAAANPQKLNWRTSIVDLLKLLDMDSSLAARKKLATELGCPTELMGDSAQMNRWLHKTVLAQVAANGGKVPQELLH